MKSDKKTPKSSIHLPAVTPRMPVAPPVYYTLDEARGRIRQQFKTMFCVPDINEYDSTEVQDVMKKLEVITRQLEVELE